MSAPLVTVIVRTYAGRQELVREALASVVAQHHRPIEVIVVEDGSGGCGHLVRALEAVDGLHPVHEPIAKAGRCVAGNRGLEVSTGELICFLDDDDQLGPDHLARLVSSLEEQPRRVAAYARALVVPTVFHSLHPLEFQEKPAWLFRGRPFSRWHLWGQNQFPIQACVFRRGLYEQHGGLDESLDLLEDWELWARYLSDGVEVGFVDEVTSLFRLPGDGGAMHGRERTLTRQISLARQFIEAREVNVTAHELRECARTVMDDHFADSSWLSRTWAALTRWRAVEVSLFGALALARRAVGRLVPRRSRSSSRSARLVEAARSGRDEEVVSLTVGEAKEAMSALWRSDDRNRYLLLVVRNRLGATGLQTRGPVRALRRRLGSAEAPPGVSGPASLNDEQWRSGRRAAATDPAPPRGR